MGIEAVSKILLLHMMLRIIIMCICIFILLEIYLQDKFLETRLLGQELNIHLVLFPMVEPPPVGFYCSDFHPQCMRMLISPQPLQYSVVSSLKFGQSDACRQHFSVLSICSSLSTSEVEPFFLCRRAILFHFLWIVYSCLLSIFIGILDFFLKFQRVL